MSAKSPLPRLMLVSDRHATGGRDPIEVLARAAAAGVELIQLRERDLTDEQLRLFAERVRASVPANTLLVINGRARVAEQLGCGLHLPADLPQPRNVRPWPLGRSVHGADELAVAARMPGSSALKHRLSAPDYFVVGHVFTTTSKPGIPGRGIKWFESLTRQASGRPVIAIGGVMAERVGPLINAGAHGVAVRSAILSDPDPAAATARFLAAIRAVRARQRHGVEG
ncbi:MAG: thiamine phosphate synthase [Acidobacteriota bacterium]|nr:MAG: thiamine phosphate synthase [Acidobacteriota bacterium]